MSRPRRHEYPRGQNARGWHWETGRDLQRLNAKKLKAQTAAEQEPYTDAVEAEEQRQ